MSRKPVSRTPAVQEEAAPQKTKLTKADEFEMAAADLNKALAIKPPLSVGADTETLKEEIKGLLPDIKEGDDLAISTWATLKKLGWKGKSHSDEKAETVGRKAKRASGGKFSDDSIITVLAKENPRRPGTRVAKLFEKYKTGMTVAAALKAGLSRGNLRKDLSRGSISIK